MLETNKIYHMDARAGLRQLDDESVNCVITSPPYWGLRDYGLEPMIWDGDENCEHEWGDEFMGDTRECHVGNNSPRWANNAHPGSDIPKHIKVPQGRFCSLCGAWRGSLGLEPTFQLYLNHLMQIFSEVKRVLRKDGTCFVNLGDSYSGSGKGIGTDRTTCKESYSDDDIKRTNWSDTGVPAKALCLIPERFIIMMVDKLGFIARNKVVWYKRNCMPSSANDRFTVDWEPVFFFTKSGKYWFEQQFEPQSLNTHLRYSQAVESGKEPIPEANAESKEINRPGYNDWRKYTGKSMLAQGRNKRCVWDIPTKPFPEAHFAVFPEALVETPILAGCPKNGIVLDLFMGAGTVAKVALRLNRKFIGFELNPEYIDMANKRIDNELRQEILAL